jgi:hypothetical protein
MLSSAWLVNGTERLSMGGRDSPLLPIRSGTGVGLGGHGHLAIRTVAVAW